MQGAWGSGFAVVVGLATGVWFGPWPERRQESDQIKNSGRKKRVGGRVEGKAQRRPTWGDWTKPWGSEGSLKGEVRHRVQGKQRSTNPARSKNQVLSETKKKRKDIKEKNQDNKYVVGYEGNVSKLGGVCTLKNAQKKGEGSQDLGGGAQKIEKQPGGG